MINEFRKKKLKLRPITYLSPTYSAPMDIPYGYIWSPHLVPKPKGQCIVLLVFPIFISKISCNCLVINLLNLDLFS